MIVRLPKLYPLQREIAACPTRNRVVVAGRRSGKTRLGSALVVNELLRERRCWWVAPVSAQSSICWRLVKSLLKNVPGVVVSRSERALFYGNGFIFFKTASEPDNLRGEGLDFLACDEFAYINEEAWESCLRPTLSDRRGRALLISSPNKENDLFHRLYKRGQDTADTEWASWQFPSSANPYLHPDEIESARKDMHPLVFAREYEGKFVGTKGALISRDKLVFGRCPDVGLCDVCVGVDPAISQKTTADFTAVVVIGRDRKSGIIYVLDAIVDHMSFSRQVEAISELAERWQRPFVYVESVAYQAALVQELIRTTSLPVNPVRPSKDKVTRASYFYNRIENNTVVFDPDLPQVLVDQVTSFPVGDHDDAVDALAHAYNGLCEVGAPSISVA